MRNLKRLVMLSIGLALVLLTACHGTFDLAVETTPAVEATIAALEAENTRMSTRLTPPPAAPTLVASATPGTAPTIDLKAIESGPSGAHITQLPADLCPGRPSGGAPNPRR
jgi:hypothetical protein